jgi:hypothetical protein
MRFRNWIYATTGKAKQYKAVTVMARTVSQRFDGMISNVWEHSAKAQSAFLTNGF